MTAATVRAGAATIFVVEDGVARRKSLRVIGERGGSLFVEPALPADVMVVTQGRGLLRDGDRVRPGELPRETVTLGEVAEVASAARAEVRP